MPEQQQTVVDLGRLVKGKYPEYADMDDAEVGRRVKAKYPEYSDFVDIESPKQAQGQAQPPVPPSFLQRIGSYLPSWHTALTTGGALAGGAIGGIGGTIAGTPISGIPGAALGGSAGASIGESIYQLGQHLA